MATNPARLPPELEQSIGLDALEINGNRVDLRTRQGRRYRDHIRELAAQLGEVSHAQGLLLRRCALLALLLERDEAVVLSGGEINESGYRSNLDKMKACLVQIGLAKKSRDVTGADNEPIDTHAAEVLGG